MNSAIARITVKGQLTIPKSVRETLHVTQGDSVMFEEKDGDILLRKVTGLDAIWARGIQTTLNEWDDELDDDL